MRVEQVVVQVDPSPSGVQEALYPSLVAALAIWRAAFLFGAATAKSMSIGRSSVEPCSSTLLIESPSASFGRSG